MKDNLYTNYYCDKCKGTTHGSGICENIECPNQPCCAKPKEQCTCGNKKTIPNPKWFYIVFQAGVSIIMIIEGTWGDGLSYMEMMVAMGLQLLNFYFYLQLPKKT